MYCNLPEVEAIQIDTLEFVVSDACRAKGSDKRQIVWSASLYLFSLPHAVASTLPAAQRHCFAQSVRSALSFEMEDQRKVPLVM
jgi:hypothetical protein